MTKPSAPRTLPGERPADAAMARMIRVDHAGEFGAARIYDGQLAVFGPTHPLTPVIRKMKDQEQSHLETFDRLVAERRVRPTALSPLWDVAGYALGAATALMGPKAAMACTAAVEEVINEHYQGQRETLKAWEGEKDFEKTVASFQADEVHHRDTAYEFGAKDAPGYRALSGAIKAGCRAAIWLSTRI